MIAAKWLCSPGDPQWLELRRTGVTATDITVIAGLVSWDSPWALYHRKRGDLPEQEQSGRMRLGLWLEDAIAAHWQQEKTGRGRLLPGGLYRSQKRPWQLATPDRLVTLYDDHERLSGTLEIKTTASLAGWGADGTGDVPDRVRAQKLWQMDTLGVPAGHVAVVCTSSGEFRSYTVHWHEQDIKNLRKAGHEFHRRMTGELPPPDVDDLTVTTDALKAVYPSAKPRAVQISDDLADGYDMACRMLADAKAIRTHAVNDVRAAMGDADTATLGERVVFRRVLTKVGGYTVAPYERDTLKRVTSDD